MQEQLQKQNLPSKSQSLLIENQLEKVEQNKVCNSQVPLGGLKDLAHEERSSKLITEDRSYCANSFNLGVIDEEPAAKEYSMHINKNSQTLVVPKGVKKPDPFEKSAW